MLLGENGFVRDERIATISQGKTLERYAGHDVDESRLVDILSGMSLFLAERVVLIDELSANKTVWNGLPQWLERADDQTTIIFVETKCDKRTKSYKALQSQATIIECVPWRLRQTRQAETWLAQYAAEQGLALSPQQVRELVARAVRLGIDEQPMIDQLLLATVISQLRHVEQVTGDHIDAVMAGESHDNVFGLLEAALKGHHQQVGQMIDRLRHHQDGHRVLALLRSQSIQLAGLVLASERAVPIDTVARDLGAHHFALQQLAALAAAMTHDEAADLIERMAWADERMKRGAAPWQMVEATMYALGQKKNPLLSDSRGSSSQSS